MDVRQLRYFVEIARLSNFTRAAEQLHIVQPAISMAIKKLEEELDLVLFNRQDKQVSLTAEGEILLDHARRILSDLRAAELEMGELRGLNKGEVRIGITPMLSAYFFPKIICAFKQSYPNLQLSVYGEGSGSIQKMISQGDLDMGVIAGGPVPDTLDVRQFLREEIVVCVRPNHPFANRQSVTFEEFSRQPLVIYKEGYYLRELIFEELNKIGASPDIVFETNLYSLILSLVRNGLGISMFLRMAVAADNELAAVSFDPPLYLDLLIGWKKHSRLSKANQAFVDFLLKASP
jgi:DNA-binding transcriptional LysR family regulator